MASRRAELIARAYARYQLDARRGGPDDAAALAAAVAEALLYYRAIVGAGGGDGRLTWVFHAF